MSCGTNDCNANFGPTSTPIINSHLGSHLIRWREAHGVHNISSTSDSSSNSRLERVAIQRLHADAVTQLLPLESSYDPSPSADSSTLVLSSSYGAEVALWTGDFKHLVSWEVYGPSYASMDLPINWMSWNPTNHQLAVASGPKNPSMPDPPENDTISPVLPKTHRISVYDLAPLISAVKACSYDLNAPCVIDSVDFISNGEVFLAHISLPNGFQLLSAAIVDAKREHSILLFHKDSLDIAKAARISCPGGSVAQFISSPDGSLLFLVKSSTLFVIRPSWDDASDSPMLELIGATKLSDSECSPLTWLRAQKAESCAETARQASNSTHSLEFLTYDSRGSLLHFEIVDSAGTDVRLVRSVSHLTASPSGSAPHALIWDDFKADQTGFGQLFRIGGSGLEVDRMSASYDKSTGIFSPITFNSPYNSQYLYKLTCCGTGFDATGEWLAIGDWGGTLAIWRTSGDHTVHHTPSAVVHLRHSMVRALDWTRDPATNRNSLMVGDISGNLMEVTLTLNAENEIVETKSKKIGNTKKTITCMQWISKENLMLAEQGLTSFWRSVLATGDSDGKLRLYGRSLVDDSMVEIAKIQAHEKMPHVTSRDIWTVSFSPCGRYIATGSEDYTVHIYSIKAGHKGSLILEQLQTLEGPDAAVTCVDWQRTPLGTLLLVVSDDRTLHIWRQETGEPLLSLHSVLRTNWEHLMITYACLEASGTRIVCATMSGYIYVFDLTRDGWRSRCKLHLGSIEGLSWNRVKANRAQLAACSSDCTASLFCLED